MVKIRINVKLIFFLFLVIAVSYALLNYKNRNNHNSSNLPTANYNESVVYLVYSPICPHCHHLMDYLDKLNPRVKIIKTTDSRKVYSCLKKYGINWDFGVPLMFANVSGVITIVSGYPDSNQDINGYFLGIQKEEQICKSGGTPIYNSNGTYMFCRIGTAKYLGNMYSVSYLISQCEKNICLPIC